MHRAYLANPASDFADLRDRRDFFVVELEMFEYTVTFETIPGPAVRKGARQNPDATLRPPRIVPDRPIWMPFKSGGGQELYSCALITDTLKMAAPSFSLPAGPPATGGTCVRAGQSSEEERRQTGKKPLPGKWICASCYATKGAYLTYGSAIVQQEVRKIWTKRAVRDGSFVPSLVNGIRAYAAHRTGGDGVDYSYFRIHDSGDFGWLPGYLDAWIEVCRALPDIRFWAPTRDWNSPRVVGAHRPKNFVLRPSALRFGDAPPDVEGLDAGSTSYLEEVRSRVQDGARRSVVDWNCPVYEQEGAEKNCRSVGCRTCWTRPRWGVNYHAH